MRSPTHILWFVRHCVDFGIALLPKENDCSVMWEQRACRYWWDGADTVPLNIEGTVFAPIIKSAPTSCSVRLPSQRSRASTGWGSSSLCKSKMDFEHHLRMVGGVCVSAHVVSQASTYCCLDNWEQRLCIRGRVSLSSTVASQLLCSVTITKKQTEYDSLSFWESKWISSGIWER